MISNPLIKDYQLRFSAGFILKETIKEFAEYFDAETSMYQSLLNFINHTITEVSVLGYDSPSTPEQHRSKGYVSSQQGNLHPTRKKNRNLTVTFTLKKSLINYMVMMRNAEIFDQTRNNEDRQFYPSIFLDFYDSNGNMIYSWEYSEIQLNKISEIRLDKKDKGIGNKSFTIDFTYNEVQMKVYLNQNKSDLKEDYKHNFLDD